MHRDEKNTINVLRIARNLLACSISITAVSGSALAQSIWYSSSPSASEININTQSSTNFHTALPMVNLTTINPSVPYFILMSPGFDVVVPSATVSVNGANYSSNSTPTGQEGVVYGIMVQGAGLWASQVTPDPFNSSQYRFTDGPSVALTSTANIYSNWQSIGLQFIPSNAAPAWQQWSNSYWFTQNANEFYNIAERSYLMETPSQQSWALLGGAALRVVSQGGDNTQWYPNNSTNGAGGNGGAITITQAGGDLYVGGSNPPQTFGNIGYPDYISSAVNPYNSGILAVSSGGAGAQYDAYSNGYWGSGGNGGDITVTVNQGSTIHLLGDLGQSAPSGSKLIAINGITAWSNGGAGGYAAASNINISEGFNIANSGNGGNVTVTFDGSITSDSTYGTLIGLQRGIVAASTGGWICGPGYPYCGQQVSNKADNPAVGLPGQVDVTLQQHANISLTNGNAVGVWALAAAGSGYGGAMDAYYGATLHSLNITTDAGSNITVGNASASTATGIFALNAGAANGSFGGNTPGGPVNISLSGNIAATAQTAIGILGASAGSTGFFDAAGYYNIAKRLPTLPSYPNGDVTITNSGNINVTGAFAAGIVAINGIADTYFTNNSPYSVSGPGLGYDAGYSTSGDPTNGGNISVSHSGKITLNVQGSNGGLGYGIVAASVGGYGGGIAGTGGGIFVGDQGGPGGYGGTVAVNLNGGMVISTQGLIGSAVLAESIGGGGGHGGNAAGVFVGVGGTGGIGGSGGAISVNLSASYPAYSYGQSVLSTTGNYAKGILAQSIGGGGGDGGAGFAVGVFGSAGIGGQGGGGGSGNTVAVNYANGLISTAGAQSHGVLAQSIGGGGGSGGHAVSGSLGAVISAAVAVGGSGGSGGSGGVVNINASNIQTSGPDGIGILAQSVGGGGGAGGGALGVALSASNELPSVSVAVGVGGSGGTGGNGGAVNVYLQGAAWIESPNYTQSSFISTAGDGAVGIVAQSVGGGGGYGGDSTAIAGVAGGEGPKIEASIAIGGSGGFGGSGGNVVVQNGYSTASCIYCGTTGVIPTSSITTQGNNAPAILAQSVGGGGGHGGIGNTGSATENLASSTSVSINVVVGGSGGSGGGGGSVQVTNESKAIIQTAGSGSSGILAQSVGGGGGNAGGAATAAGNNTVKVAVNVGGNGGSGGAGGTVSIYNYGSITTGTALTASSYFVTGGDSVGILAQSIGGGGGNGGSSDPAAAVGLSGLVSQAAKYNQLINNPPSTSYQASVALGGNGGSGNTGGFVNVENYGTIITNGVRAYGVLAQSIGGGGGTAGTVSATPVSTQSSVYSGTVGLGGAGGIGANGGSVSYSDTSAMVTTKGYGAAGIFLQSVGGGGGIASEGSAGGNTKFNIGLGFNGSGGGAGNGGAVSGTFGQSYGPSTYVTNGDDAPAIFLMSVGGGGGAASGACTNSTSKFSASIKNEDASACFGNGSGTSIYASTSSFNVQVGGSKGTSGDGGTVTANINSSITTNGARSTALIAQSVGGGGGSLLGAAGNISVANVGPYANQNDAVGGNVAVTLNGSSSITTYGAGAWGILAQSIGGGGGIAADTSLPLYMASLQKANTIPLNCCANQNTNHGPDGGAIALSISGNIFTYGNYAHGVVAQSVGGGGGIGIQNGQLALGNSYTIYGMTSTEITGQGGAINITQSAGSIISASGSGSVGIIAQSTGNNSYMSPISIAINGSVNGGTGSDAAAIIVSGGGATNNGHGFAPNTITVNAGGSVGTGNGASGNAIFSYAGYTNVINNAGGTITGAINLGASPGDFTNSGTWNVGSGTTNVFATNTVTNNGVIHVVNTGGGTAVISGGYKQTAAGRLVVDVDSTTSSGAVPLLVKGNAQIAGAIVPNILKLLPGTAPVISATGTLSSSASTASTLLFNWQTAVSGNRVSITPNANFNPNNVPLTRNQAYAANYFQRAWANADPALATRFGYLAQLNDGASYQQVLNSYAGRGLGMGPVLASLYSADLLSAPLSCQVFAGGSTKVIQDNCVWGKVVGGVARSTATDGFSGSNMMWRMGGQQSIAPDVYVGAAFGIGGNRVSTDGFSGSGGAYDISAAIKYLPGNWEFSGALGLFLAQYQNSRYTLLPAAGSFASESSLQQSSVNSYSGSVRLRAAYSFAFDSWYLRPYADLDVITMHMPGFSEYSSGGASGVTLYRQASTDTQVRITPMLEFGLRRDLSDGWIFRPTLGIGMSAQSNRTLSSQLDVIGASPLNGSITSTTTLPQAMGRVSAAVQFYRVGVFDLRFEYDLMAAPSFIGQSGFFKAAYHF